MKYTLTINHLDRRTRALLNLIKASQNVVLKKCSDEEIEEFYLSDEQKLILDSRDKNHAKGRGKQSSWDTVKNRLKSV
ncbi:MAG: hypothetical protein IPM74_18525 [Crocinitomicaceae bacterium]|nr:hypothetical protein [Crocinitomicaceae bacterium]MBK8927837.1 hypothetical protein [Crocinitomicaceae bacterium]